MTSISFAFVFFFFFARPQRQGWTCRYVEMLANVFLLSQRRLHQISICKVVIKVLLRFTSEEDFHRQQHSHLRRKRGPNVVPLAFSFFFTIWNNSEISHHEKHPDKTFHMKMRNLKSWIFWSWILFACISVFFLLSNIMWNIRTNESDMTKRKKERNTTDHTKVKVFLFGFVFSQNHNVLLMLQSNQGQRPERVC